MEAVRRAGVIYGLYEPSVLLPFYVGFTTNLHYRRRLVEHIYDARNKRNKNIQKEQLILELLNAGSKPEIKVLEEVFGGLKEIKEREVFWIAELKPSTNYTPGGDWNPMLSEKREQSIANSKETKTRKRRELAASLGLTEEELIARRKASYVVDAHLWPSCQPDVLRKYSKEHKAKRRQELGEEAWKKLVADEKRNWYANISPEQKEEFRRREREYRRQRREKRKHQASK